MGPAGWGRAHAGIQWRYGVEYSGRPSLRDQDFSVEARKTSGTGGLAVSVLSDNGSQATDNGEK